MGFALPEARPTSRARLAVVAATLVLACGAAFLVGQRNRARAEVAPARGTGEASILRVPITKPKVVASDRALELPGAIVPLEETVVYPRASGYVRRWTVDIGSRVKEGDLLVEIDTPEIDQQLLQAKARLAQAQAGVAQAEASSAFAAQSLKRFEQLAPAGLATQQDLEKQRAQTLVEQANVAVAKASLEAQRAEIQRLAQLKAFGHVTAPFSGTVVSRTVARGALVSAGNGTPLFRLAATDTVRVVVSIPQDVAPALRVGVEARVTVREYPGRPFAGKVAVAAGALEPATRTMRTEVHVPNPKGELLAGMFAEVSLTLPVPHRAFELPATALLNDARGLRVAVVDATDSIRLVPVTLERDTGATILIATGLTGDERVVRLASSELTEGRVVAPLAQ